MVDLAIPGMMVSKRTGDELLGILRAGGGNVRLEEAPGMAEPWLELSMMQWPESEDEFSMVLRQMKQKNADSPERLRWLEELYIDRFGSPSQRDEL